MRRGALAAIRMYQRAVSPGLPAACRFEPSCSMYSYEAIEVYGLWKGGRLMIGRLVRCHPFNAMANDPVP